MDPLMTPEQVAEYLSVPARTLSHWRGLDEGPVYVKIGKHVRYQPAEVLAYAVNPEKYNFLRRLVVSLAAYMAKIAA